MNNTKEYFYGMRLRGFSIGAQPKNGFIRREDSTSGRYHDILVYDRKLTEKELADYELDYLWGDSDGDKCVHECTIGINYLYDEFMEPLSFSDLCEKCESNIKFIKEFTQTTVYDIEDLLFEFIKNFDRRTNKLAIRFSYCPYCGMKIDWANLKYVAKKYVEEMRAEYE